MISPHPLATWVSMVTLLPQDYLRKVSSKPLGFYEVIARSSYNGCVILTDDLMACQGKRLSRKED